MTAIGFIKPIPNLRDVIDLHAPIKKRIVKNNQVPYMNSELRKVINVRNLLWRKFERQSCGQNWERYRTHRNLVVKFRKRSKSEYLRKKCAGSGNSKEFWSAIKPLFSQKVKPGNDTVLIENGTLVKKIRKCCKHYE